MNAEMIVSGGGGGGGGWGGVAGAPADAPTRVYKHDLLYIHLAGKYRFSSLVKDESYYLEPTQLKILPLPHSVHARARAQDATCIIKPTAICVDFLIYVYLSLNPAVYLPLSNKRSRNAQREALAT